MGVQFPPGVPGNLNHGGYGETVITLVCGTSITGSIPVSRPMRKPPATAGGFLIEWFLD